MPRYRVSFYNEESGMLHTEYDNILAADEDSAKTTALENVKSEIGYQHSADGGQSIASLPRFRVAVTPTD